MLMNCQKEIRAALTSFFLVVGTMGWAQENVIAKVVDAVTGVPLPYATIAVHRTTRGTITNGDGYFRISMVDRHDSLRISYVGYAARIMSVAEVMRTRVVELQNATQQLREAVIRPDDGHYERVIRAARWLRKAPKQQAKLFFGLETYSDSTPVEMIHAYFNARFGKARLLSSELKNGRIGLMKDEGRYFVNYNTTRAFALMDVTAEESRFPVTPLKHTNVADLRLGFIVEQLSEAVGPDGVDHLRVIPRRNNPGFTAELWLEPKTDRVRALELHCTNCPKYPFIPLFDHGHIDTVDMRFRQTWTWEVLPRPEVMELTYRVAYTGREFFDTYTTHAVMHAYDEGQAFITPLISYPELLPDHQRMCWLPTDSAWWQGVAPPLPTERHQRDMEFLTKNNVAQEQWYEDMESDKVYFVPRFVVWSATNRITIADMKTLDPKDRPSRTKWSTLFESYVVVYAPPRKRFEAQLYLDMDTVDGKLLHRSHTVLDGYKSFIELDTLPWTPAFMNIWFDMCEVERQAMEVRLSARGTTVQLARAIHAYHSKRLAEMTTQLMYETSNGMQLRPLRRWNDRVNQALGIDNLKLIGLDP